MTPQDNERACKALGWEPVNIENIPYYQQELEVIRLYQTGTRTIYPDILNDERVAVKAWKTFTVEGHLLLIKPRVADGWYWELDISMTPAELHRRGKLYYEAKADTFCEAVVAAILAKEDV